VKSNNNELASLVSAANDAFRVARSDPSDDKVYRFLGACRAIALANPGSDLCLMLRGIEPETKHVLTLVTSRGRCARMDKQVGHFAYRLSIAYDNDCSLQNKV
jgi:hypothetical protein